MAWSMDFLGVEPSKVLHFLDLSDISDNILCLHLYFLCLKSTTSQDLENDQFSMPTQFCGDMAREWTGLAKSVAGSLKESTAGNILGTLKSIPHRKSTVMISWEPKGSPQCHPPPENKALLRDY